MLIAVAGISLAVVAKRRTGNGGSAVEPEGVARSAAPADALFTIWENDLYGVMDASGTVLVPPRFNTYPVFSEGLAAIADGTEFGYIDRTGDWVVPPKFRFESAWGFWKTDATFSQGRAIVHIGGSLAIIDRTGNPAFISNFVRIVPFQEGLAYAWWSEGEHLCEGFVDLNGRTIIRLSSEMTPTPPVLNEPLNQLAPGFSEGLAPVNSDKAHGYIDRSGKVVIPLQFLFAQQFREGLAAVNIGKRWGYINRDGHVVISPTFGLARQFNEGLAPFFEKGWGYIDQTGQVVIPARFQNVGPLVEGLAPVEIEKLWGFIGRDGKVVIPAVAKKVSAFKSGVALFEPYGYIDRTGAFVWMAAEYRHLSPTTVAKLVGG